MDNTLFDFVSAQISACNAVVGHLGRGAGLELFEYFRREGKGFEDHENIRDYMISIGLSPDGQYSPCCRIYEEVKLSRITPYPGIHETLTYLRGIGLSLSVVTDAVHSNAEKRLQKAGVLQNFDCIVTPDQTGKRKPDPDPFLFALRTMGVPSHEAIMVGDSLRRDIEPGRRLGMVTAYAAYGDRFFSDKETYPADLVLRSPSELCRILKTR